jgi:two-component system sensor histidine kinase EvgS
MKPNKRMEMDSKKPAFFRTSHAYRWERKNGTAIMVQNLSNRNRSRRMNLEEVATRVLGPIKNHRVGPRCALAILSLLWLCVAGIAQEEAKAPLRSGCEVDYPPFCIVHEDGQADGFAVELMRAALAKMGREVTFRTGQWAEVRSWLERDEIDALPLVGRTPEREKLFDFTIPYLTMHGAIVVRKDTEDVHTLDDLRGRRVGVMKGDNAEEFLRRKDRGLEIIATPTFTDAFRELSDGRCDAVVIQRLVALRLLEQTALTNLRIIERPIPDFSQAWCFAV